MIEPMKKVSVVLLNKEKEEALKALRKVGLVHLEKVEGSSEKLNAFKEQERVNSSQYGKPGGDIRVKKAVFTYEKNGKGVMATADNLLFEDNLYVNNGKIYTIKLSPFNPHRCYFPAYQLYRGCSIPAKIYIFVMRIIPKITGAGFLAIAWYTYTNFILK